jgi:hypothetical protein
MSANLWLTIFAPPAIFCLCGCESPPKTDAPTELYVRISDRGAFVDQTLTQLRKRDFQPRFVDRREGLILAGPTTSAQWFEPWRIDSRGGYQAFESSLHTIRRTVTVRLAPTGAKPPASSFSPASMPPTTGPSTPGVIVSGDSAPASAPACGDFRLSVQVEKERYSAPERQATTALGAMAIYNERIPTTEGLRMSRAAGEHWVPLGRDVLLEAYLLERIAAVPSVAESSLR